MDWFDKFVVACLLITSLGMGWGARGWVDGYRVWAETPIVFEAEGPRDVAVCVSSDLPTLWHIAREYYPGEHTGAVVFEIQKANPHLDPGLLQIGQEVILP